jgi:hypothetical protein
VTFGQSSPENTHLRFKALAQTQVVPTHFKLTSRLLEKVQPTANLDRPPVVDTNLSVVQLSHVCTFCALATRPQLPDIAHSVREKIRGL